MSPHFSTMEAQLNSADALRRWNARETKLLKMKIEM